MVNEEGELTESEEAFTKNTAIFLTNLIRIYNIFPKKLFILISGLISLLIIGIEIFSAIFEYDKIDANTITLDGILNLFTLKLVFLIIMFIVISFSILLTKSFCKYIVKKEQIISEMKQNISRIVTDCNDKLKLMEGQNAAQPIFINKDLIQNMIVEIENYINLKENKEIKEKYLSVLEVKLGNNKIIEITASKNGSSLIGERMIFEICRKKQIRGSLVHDPYGLVSVYSCSEDSFKSILIDSRPEVDYWDEMFIDLKEKIFKHVDDLYLKVYIPKEIIRTDKDTLSNLLTGLKQL